ncbi:16S rRNA (cytosine(967)-C(5))-methyltransferase RsmB [Kyrpidia spormannii]|uniref:16S rRNA (Cytosine(967)-C(5))-methyltransferase RsmB n=1 Tax=Kyrpidia spormannii TaxID=2055160 RepID=A0ACA8ZA40_9BACL|nr:16S rRNA (cytosine(967)-C(5))-methyltransferase RsmB [Kyrpidia spormannii]CAB3392686.1 16S rRNA (Cytosine(967)-C(5))-methyltransferase RsmB [Kyrpidia spormannii]
MGAGKAHRNWGVPGDVSPDARATNSVGDLQRRVSGRAGAVSPARRGAFEALRLVEERRAYSHIALRQVLNRLGADRRDSALATEIVQGTLRWQQWLDEQINAKSRIPITRLDAVVRVTLRMAVYQLYKLRHCAPHAVVHDAVELVKGTQPRAASYVNGVLRTLERQQETPPQPRAAESWEDPGNPEELARRTSHPTWMVERWWSWLGPEATIALCQSNNEPPPLALRVNLWCSSVAEVMESVREAGGEGRPSPVIPGVLRVSGVDVSRLSTFQSGACSVQDESATLAAWTLQPEPGGEVLDLCAAPGGKSAHLAEWMKGTGRVTAVDIHPHKIPLIEQTARRLGLPNVHPVCADGRDAPSLGIFDAALVDAPCSGLGVLRRRPELKWRRRPEDIQDLVKLQGELLAAAARAVRPDGILVYATCTVCEAENDGVVEDFLAGPEGADFDLEDPAALWPDPLGQMTFSTRFGRQILPFHFGGDGFYYARLRRKPSGAQRGIRRD